jgi:acyl-homoserine-lactone acylase
MRSRAPASGRARRRARLIAPLVVASAVITLLAGAVPAPASAAAFSATIRRTEDGIPHITAPNYAGLGYGYG